MRCFWRPALLVGHAMVLLHLGGAFGLWRSLPISLSRWQSSDLVLGGISLGGLVLGITASLIELSWLPSTLAGYTQFSLVVTLSSWIALAIWHGTRFALVSWLWARGTSEGWPQGLCAATAVVTAELVFPYLWPTYLGSALAYHPVMIQAAELLGPPGVSIVVVLGTEMLSALWKAGVEKSAHALRFTLGYGAILVLVVALSWLRMFTVESALRSSQTINIGVIQTNLDPKKPRPNRDNSLLQHLRINQELQSRRPTGLVVWSETADNVAVERSAVESRFQAILGKHLDGSVVLGAPVMVDRDARTFLNSAFLLDDSGSVKGQYDKRLLVPIGEYVPLGPLRPHVAVMLPHTKQIVPGGYLPPLEYEGHRLGVSICQEDVFAFDYADTVSLQRPSVLVNLTNDGWFSSPIAARHHFALSIFRAVEHRRALARSAKTGVSAIIGPTGAILGEIPIGAEGALSLRIPVVQTRSFFADFGRYLIWIFVPASLLLCFRRRQRINRTEEG